MIVWLALLAVPITVVIWDILKDGRDRNTLAMTIATIVMAVATVATALVSSMQWEALRDQLSLIEADQRPWVSSNVTIIGNLVPSATGLRMTVHFTMKNSGKSPAHEAFVGAATSLTGWGPNQSAKICKEAAKSMLKHTVFPGETVVQPIEIAVPEAELSRFRSKPDNAAAAVLPALGACVAYKDSLSKKFHHTPSSFYISLVGSDASPLPKMLENQPISTSTLQLVSVPMLSAD